MIICLESFRQKYLLTFFHLVSFKKLKMPTQEDINDLKSKIDGIKRRLEGTDISLVSNKNH